MYNHFNQQKYLYDLTPGLKNFPLNFHPEIPREFEEKGYTLLSGLSSEHEAVDTLYSVSKFLRTRENKFSYLFAEDIRLTKADKIPVCCDYSDNGCQALHFDMGMPFLPLENEKQAMVTLIGLYQPIDSLPSKAKTRVLPLKGLLKDWNISEKEEEQLKDYLENHGDGPREYNSKRLQLFARFLDAVKGYQELKNDGDKSMAKWFSDEKDSEGLRSLEREYSFYQNHGLNLKNLEEQIQIEPGQMLIIDNTRVVHGRIGQRQRAELYQFMMGTDNCSVDNIHRYRQDLLEYLRGQ